MFMESFATCILGQSCNNNCIFCTRPADPKAPSVWGFTAEKTTAEVLNGLESLRKPFDSIILTGGEPAIRNDFFEILEKCMALGFQTISVQTNARKFSDAEFAENVLKILGSKADFYVSFHSSKPALFNSLRGTASFQESVSGIKNLLALGAKARTNTVVMKPNYKELPELVSFLSGLGIKEMEFMLIHPNGRAWANRAKLIPRASATIPYLKKASETAEKNNVSLTFVDFPFCALGSLSLKASERFLSPATVSGSRPAKAKGRECGSCSAKQKCPGIWSSCLKVFPFEFKPFK
jgi:MoaA/NifB/PqqE/SkfB family radical SAM enzyme